MQNTMNNGKEFPIGAVFTAATGCVFPNAERTGNNMEETSAVLSFMVGESLFTHALVRAGKVCAPYIKEWYPFIEVLENRLKNWANMADLAAARLAGTDTDRNIRNAFWAARLDEIIAQYGEMLTLWQIPSDDYEHKSPEQELIDMGFKGEIIQVDSDENDISPYGDLPAKTS